MGKKMTWMGSTVSALL